MFHHLLLGLLLLFLLRDVTNTTTPNCAGCLLKCQAAKVNGCTSSLSAGVLATSGACSTTSLVQACLQCGALCPTLPPAPAPVPVPVPVPPAPASTPGVCLVWGDPHIMTFDKKRVDFYTQGEYWIVKSSTVQIQGRYKATHVVHLSLPMGVNVQINRWTEASEGKYINAKITMPAVPGQDGHCGNANGNAADDERLQIRARV